MTPDQLRRWSNLALPVAAIVLAVGAAVLPGQGADSSEGTDEVSVEQSTFTCPKRGSTMMTVGQLVPGDERTIEFSDDGDLEAQSSDATRWDKMRLKHDGAIVTQSGEGSGAVGFTATKAGDAAGGGLAVAACEPVVDEAWFLGLGTADKRSSVLTLTNMSDTPAVADVRLWNAEGEVDAVRSSGISIEPFSIRRIRVSALAAGEPEMAAQVVRRRGVLTAAVVDESTARFSGTEAISPAQRPSGDQVVAGVDGPLRGKTLLLLNPGDQNARINVTALTADGPVADADLQDLQVKAGRYRTIAIPDSLGAGGQALRVTSDRDVVAAVRVAPDVNDFMMAESAPVLDRPAIAPLDVGAGAAPARLVVSALDDDAEVQVVVFDARMREIGRTVVELSGQTTGTIDVSDIEINGDAAYATVTADGPVVGAVTYTAGDRASSLMLRPAPTTIDVPVVLAD